jgi:putative aldouronate transport system permease protein
MNTLRRKYAPYKELYLMLLPCVIVLLIFEYAPMWGTLIAFKDYKMQFGLLGSSWVGLDHFANLFLGDEFQKCLVNTIIISFAKTLCGFFAPVVFAILLNEIRLKWFAKSVQTLSLLPHFFSWVILAGIFRLVFATSGPVNEVLSIIGFKIEWFSNDFAFLGMLIGTEIWKGVGYGAIIYLASLSSIDPSLYEAAEIDGANRWQQIRNVTIPALFPTMITLLVLTMGSVLSAGFDQIYNLYNPAVSDVSEIIDTYVLKRLEALQFEVGTAAGLFRGLVGMSLVIIVNKIANKLSNNEQGLY